METTQDTGPKCSTPTSGPWAQALAGTVVAQPAVTSNEQGNGLPPVGCSHTETYRQIVLEGQYDILYLTCRQI